MLTQSGTKKHRKLRPGDWVEVRGKAEILATLDDHGCLDGMPFQPEMFQYCGQRFQVYKRAHKTCDTVFPIRGRRLDGAVHLKTRCDGQAHGGCQAGCLLFWKEAWLKRVEGPAAAPAPIALRAEAAPDNGHKSEQELKVWNAAERYECDGTPVYSCQATRLPYFTQTLHWWDLRQYIEDLTSGNIGLKRLLDGLVYSAYYNLSARLEGRFGSSFGLPALYNALRRIWGGPEWVRTRGRIPSGQPTPAVNLNLQEGELVRVKPLREILATVNTSNKNRGMYWDAEMVPYCGKTFRVLRRVDRIIDERTGKMLEMKTPCIILDSVFCQARYSACRMFCPRSIYSYWREIWLERVQPANTTGAQVPAAAAQQPAETEAVESARGSL